MMHLSLQESMYHQNNIIIIGNSVVEHSKSLIKLNKRVINIDSFNDDDLKGECYLNKNSFGFVNDDVIEIIKKLNLKKEDTIIIVASGFDTKRDYDENLKKYGYLANNKQNIFAETKYSKILFNQLYKSGIKVPKDYNLETLNKEKKLIKNKDLSGGFGIKDYTKDYILADNEYIQEFIAGNVHSILFIVNKKKDYKLIGINKIFNKKTKNTNYCFSGAISNIKLESPYIELLKNIINFFVNNFDLVGINGIDFVIKGSSIYFLEINPRLTQTCFMYDDYFKLGYVNAHIDSIIDGKMPDIVKEENSSYAFETIFAKEDFKYTFDLLKYDFVSNVPKTNCFIEAGDPICTIRVKSYDEKKADKLLSDNISLIKNELNNIEII